MSVVPNEIIFYGSANMPEADGVTVGGALDLTKRVSFADIPSNQALDLVSSSASDTAVKCQVTGRDATGTVVTPAAITLTGTTVLASSFGGQVFERILAAVITGGAIAGLSNPGGTGAVGDIAILANTRTLSARTAQAGSANKSGTTPPLFKLQAGDGATVGALPYGGVEYLIRITGGTGSGQLRKISAQYSASAYGTDIVAVNRDWSVVPDGTSTYDIAAGILFDLLPNPVKAVTRLFATAQADVPGGSTRTFYEKVFALNTNTVTALIGAALQILSETPGLPSGALLDLALCKVLNDTQTDANRQTLPTNGDASALTFVTQPSAVSIIASPFTLPNGNSAGVSQGIWLRLTLPAGTTVYKGAALARATGATV